ncbi:uncharacterized protein MCYG_03950 [Microsporum canis CBS 113480]|uniref:Uncharacterized protein n=1 Tax=Arthroderma otae (strain ATCC MYA-4605 / CBS 113480) TaxID=554155 RepID=C5FMM8_ARTOC|nr:uncharacterized protein MCYG_03950 [Microsporum canis CBS 113480]EEQ31131.1 predicted protein [Microsporum canis CBS 113480]
MSHQLVPAPSSFCGLDTDFSTPQVPGTRTRTQRPWFHPAKFLEFKQKKPNAGHLICTLMYSNPVMLLCNGGPVFSIKWRLEMDPGVLPKPSLVRICKIHGIVNA